MKPGRTDIGLAASALNDAEWWTLVTPEAVARIVLEAVAAPRITHGRHCTCSACEREDWTNPDLACCGMHGKDCPALYRPLGAAGDLAA